MVDMSLNVEKGKQGFQETTKVESSAPLSSGYDKASHRAAMHDLVSERTKEGKPVWDRRVNVRTITQDDNRSVEEKAKAVAALVRESAWFKEVMAEKSDPELLYVIEELEDEVQDAEHYDTVMHALYDEADYDRVWLGWRSREHPRPGLNTVNRNL
jgi:hypothetical protein